MQGVSSLPCLAGIFLLYFLYKQKIWQSIRANNLGIYCLHKEGVHPEGIEVPLKSPPGEDESKGEGGSPPENRDATGDC